MKFIITQEGYFTRFSPQYELVTVSKEDTFRYYSDSETEEDFLERVKNRYFDNPDTSVEVTLLEEAVSEDSTDGYDRVYRITTAYNWLIVDLTYEELISLIKITDHPIIIGLGRHGSIGSATIPDLHIYDYYIE